MASRASRSETCTSLRNSRLDDAAFASSRFAPTEVAERRSWSTIARSLYSTSRLTTRDETAQANLNVRSRMSCERSVGMRRPCSTIPATSRPFGIPKRMLREASRVRRNCAIRSGFAFRILHFAFRQGLAGSMSTAILRHFSCLNRMTLSAARVKWPTTMASQISDGCRPRAA